MLLELHDKDGNAYILNLTQSEIKSIGVSKKNKDLTRIDLKSGHYHIVREKPEEVLDALSAPASRPRIGRAVRR